MPGRALLPSAPYSPRVTMPPHPLASALRLHQAGDVVRAESGYRAVLARDPSNADARYLLGLILQQSRQWPEAIVQFERAAALRQGFADAQLQLAITLDAAGRKQDALVLLFDAVGAPHATVAMRRVLATLLDGVALGTADATVRAVLLSLLLDRGIAAQAIAGAVLGLITHSVAYLAVRADRTDEAAMRALLADELLLAVLPRIIVTDEALERVLTDVRRALVAGLTLPIDAVCALAAQCWNTEYAFAVSDGERAAVGRHRRLLENRLADARALDAGEFGTFEHSLAVLALYEPLHELPEAHRLLGMPESAWSPAVRALLVQQVAEPFEEMRLAAALTSFPEAPESDAAGEGSVGSVAEDSVSRAVRAQYEVHPYPRWLSLTQPATTSVAALAASLRSPHAVPSGRHEVLVAGGGTGQQPIQLARTLPDARILAIDLSSASLAYAQRMAAALDVPNVTFVRGNLLALQGVDGRFAVVSCSGVLHHLHDPMSGWQRLVKALAPYGIMKIGLYSAAARTGVEAARTLATEQGFPGSDDGVRACRQAILALPAGHPARQITQFADFFSVSGCRDLVMHVQERTYTIPEIAASLETLGLQFLGFQLPQAVIFRFTERFGEGANTLDLASWHLFERENPDTFAAMYQFWCTRPGSPTSA